MLCGAVRLSSKGVYMMMFDPLSLMGDASPVMVDTTFMSTKSYLQAEGFVDHFGEPDTVNRFNEFAQSQLDHNAYAGKSLELGEGGRAALLRHQLIISGKFGTSLDQITPESWNKINEIIKINYMNKYGDPK